MNKKFRLLLLMLIASIVLGLSPWEPSGQAATTITVQNVGDGAANAANCPGASCRLRDAIAKAAAGDTINFSVTGLITLNSGELLISKNLAISGPGGTNLTISGNNAGRVLNISSGKTVTISGLTIANGNSGTGNGGGILNAGNLTVNYCTISGNTANEGGGIYNAGTLTVTLSLLSGNTAYAGGGILNNQNNTVATLINSTLSGNSSTVHGGTIYNGGFLGQSGMPNGTVNLTNCTITGGSAGSGYVPGIYSLGYLNTRNSIIAGYCPSGPACGYDVYGNLNSQGYNLIGKFSEITGVTTGNITAANPLLAPLGNYGGQTQTHALLPGSPAINAGDNCVTLSGGCLAQPLTGDQRGLARKVGSAVDIGAFESRGFSLVIASGNNQSAVIQDSFANPLSVTVTALGAGEPVNGGIVTFTPPLSGASCTLAGNPATVTGNTATTGTVKANLTIGGAYSVTATATGASVVNFALTNACPPAGILYQPVTQGVCPGSAATFNVTAAYPGYAKYQWRKNGVNISGATGSSYTTPATTAADNGALYSVVVSSSCGSAPVTSADAKLIVQPPTAISTQPANQAVCLGSAATFNIAATGIAPFSYQWRKNGVSIAGATSSSYTTPATTATDNGALYSVVVTGACGTPVTSANATLSFNPPPAISTQPANQTVCPGSTATFSVAATGAGLTYQWRKNGVNISGATSSSYTTPATTAADSGKLYSVVVTGACGTAVTSASATLTVNPPTAISSQPANQTVCPGSTATFSVAATGTGTLTYQWRKNGVNIAGATYSSYTTPATTTTDNGALYSVIVSSTCGTPVTSANATLTVSDQVIITAQPQSKTICYGLANFSVTAKGAGLTYQWRRDGVNIVGATSSSYQLNATMADSGARFSVVVSSSCGTSVTSANALLTVNGLSGITTQPQSQTAPLGSTATFSVTAAFNGAVSYQWRKNGVNIGTATASSSYTTPPTTAADNGALYSVVVTSIPCPKSITSANATLTVVNSASLATASDTELGRKAKVAQVVSDYDGDGKSDLAIWRGEEGQWQILYSSTGETRTLKLGDSSSPEDVPVSGDFDGDGKADLAVFSRGGPDAAHWLIKRSSDGEIVDVFFGSGSDVPVAADYDGDGKTDIAVWRGDEGNWFILRSSDDQMEALSLGSNAASDKDMPVPADYDGDGKADVAVFRQEPELGGHWYIRRSSDGAMMDKYWGLGTDVPVPADYDGDGKTDIAVWRASDGAWYVVRSSDSEIYAAAWGETGFGDVPVPGDYDGDGQTDLAVWRAREGQWYIRCSRNNSVKTVANGKLGGIPVTAKH